MGGYQNSDITTGDLFQGCAWLGILVSALSDIAGASREHRGVKASGLMVSFGPAFT